MKKIFTLIALCAIVTSCGQTGEQSKSAEDLEIFLASVEEENLTEGPTVSSAYWISSNFITYDSQKIVADYSKRYIYFALHLDPEIPTMPILANEYTDQLLAIEELRQKIPQNIMIYVKENPKQTDIFRPQSFFDRIKKLENVKLVNDNTYKLIDGSCFVATISGTVGWEAIISGKNVVLFGKSWYQNFSGAFLFNKNFNFDEVLNYKIDKKTLNSSLKKFLEKTSRGMIYFDFSNKAIKITDIYPEYNRSKNIEYLANSLKKIIGTQK